jgi:transposase, IS5 family
MDAVVPWQELLEVVEPHDRRVGGRGCPPVGLASMLRIYVLKQSFALSDRQMEDGLYDVESWRCCAGSSNLTAALPDETTILNFRPLWATRFDDVPARGGQRPAEGQGRKKRW